MTYSLHEKSGHFTALLEHLETFDDSRRHRLAELYGADSAAAVDIASRWCQRPQVFRDVLDRELGESTGRAVLDQLVHEHDLPVDISWVEAQTRTRLTEVGMLKPADARRADQPDVDWIPGAVAAILAPELSGDRPTVPVLLGARQPADIAAIADQYDIRTDGSTIEVVLSISEAFSQASFLDTIMAELGHPDWIGPALMTLELGGICYWREVFGHQPAEGDSDSNVVPLMGSDERDEQRRIADRLVELGVLYRVESAADELALVALPEELWSSLWSMGADWLIDWTAMSFRELEDVAVRQPRRRYDWDAQTVLKWIVCEAVGGQLTCQGGRPSEEAIEALAAKSDRMTIDWASVVGLGRDLDIIDCRGESVKVHDRAGDRLDVSATGFCREVLAAWCAGQVGSRCDEGLPGALGLDAQWVEHLVDLFGDHDRAVLPWMRHSGVPPMETGSGCLREVDEGDDDFMLLEVGLTNTCLYLTKIHWLDLLSLLEPGAWHSTQRLADLLQMAASFAVFSQLGHIVSDPHSNYYFPLQRPSLLSSPVHTEAFDAWLDDIVGGLLAPVGAAEVSADAQRVWLDVDRLRAPSPADWPEEPRREFVRQVMGIDADTFEIADGDTAGLRKVAELDDSDRVSVQLPMDALLEACSGRQVVGYDGKSLRLK